MGYINHSHAIPKVSTIFLVYSKPAHNWKVISITLRIDHHAAHFVLKTWDLLKESQKKTYLRIHIPYRFPMFESPVLRWT